MGTYRNPSLQKGYTTSNINTGSSSAGSGLTQAINAQRQRARDAEIASNANWEIYERQQLAAGDLQKQIGDAVDIPQKGGGTKGFINKASLEDATRDYVKGITEAKIRLESHDGWYDMLDEDIATVRNSKNDIARLPEIFGDFSLVMDKLMTTQMGYAPGDINPDGLNPHLHLAKLIGNTTSGIGGEISYRRSYSEQEGSTWEMVVSGESVEKLNKELYAKTGDEKYNSNEYAFSYNQISDAVNDSDSDEYTFGGMFNTNPNVHAETEDLKTANILDNNNQVSKRFITTKQVVKGNQVFQQEMVDVASVARELKPYSNAFASRVINNNQVLQAFITSRASMPASGASVEQVDGMQQISYIPYQRDESGNIKTDKNGRAIEGEKVTLGDNGFYKKISNKDTQQFQNYTKEEHDQILNFVQDQFIRDNNINAKINPVLDRSATDALARKNAADLKEQRRLRALAIKQGKENVNENIITSSLIKNLKLYEAGDQTDFSVLESFKEGLKLTQDPDDLNIHNVYSREDKDGNRKFLFTVDLAEPEQALQMLLQQGGAKAFISIPEEKTATTQDGIKLSAIVANLPSEITEETFMETLSKSNKDLLTKYGITVSETDVGSDVLLITRRDGKTTEIDLEDGEWKNKWRKIMKDMTATNTTAKVDTPTNISEAYK